MLCIGILHVLQCFLTLYGECVVCMKDLIKRMLLLLFLQVRVFYIFIVKNNCKHKKGLANAHPARMYFILYFYYEKQL
jgi:hypothetical protein